ncbi:MAG TPA: DegT/DnrJ/EryC1/StrS family aminotransferase [Terriglobales bacterium]|nr:DegT/DnrJ/EryC1/StrS family aminotransferase [Terriglobales bacterium]
MQPALAPAKLAIEGGKPIRTAPFPPWPFFSEDEIAGCAEVMRSGRVNYWTGEQGKLFEQEFAQTCGCRYALAVSNGTSALELSLRALGIGPGDEVVTSSRTFIASASSAVVCGARAVFADVDRETQNITAEAIRAALTPRARAIVAVHLGGWPCDMDPILELARERKLFVIEDCAQAQGAIYGGRPVGSFGDAAAFSFCQDKIMTTAGEGGMIVTNREDVWERAAAYRDHGRSNASRSNGNAAGFPLVHDLIGTNARMTEIQAAIGRWQLKKVPEWGDIRRRHARALNERFVRIAALRPLFIPEIGIEPVFYRYYVFVRPERLRAGWSRDRIIEAIRAEGTPCFMGSCGEVYLEKAFASARPEHRFPMARELSETSLAFLVHPTLTAEEIEDTCRAVEKVFAFASL